MDGLPIPHFRHLFDVSRVKPNLSSVFTHFISQEHLALTVAYSEIFQKATVQVYKYLEASAINLDGDVAGHVEYMTTLPECNAMML